MSEQLDSRFRGNDGIVVSAPPIRGREVLTASGRYLNSAIRGREVLTASGRYLN
jgi:hypothetical protein